MKFIMYVVFERSPVRSWVGGGWVDDWTLTLLAGFTVKHEMVEWLKKNDRTPDDTDVYRMCDGGQEEPEEMDWSL
jgi:hypothetical protein